MFLALRIWKEALEITLPPGPPRERWLLGRNCPSPEILSFYKYLLNPNIQPAFCLISLCLQLTFQTDIT